MSFLFSRLLLGLLLCACLLSASACSFFRDPEPPDDELLRQRVNALIVLGWGWLHAENVTIQQISPENDRFLVHFGYDVVIDQDEDLLPPEQLERYHRFLPMCADVRPQKGARCHTEESLSFVKTEEYGWMPEIAVQLAPQMLPQIVQWPGQPKAENSVDDTAP